MCEVFCLLLSLNSSSFFFLEVVKKCSIIWKRKPSSAFGSREIFEWKPTEQTMRERGKTQQYSSTVQFSEKSGKKLALKKGSNSFASTSTNTEYIWVFIWLIYEVKIGHHYINNADNFNKHPHKNNSYSYNYWKDYIFSCSWEQIAY